MLVMITFCCVGFSLMLMLHMQFPPLDTRHLLAALKLLQVTPGRFCFLLGRTVSVSPACQPFLWFGGCWVLGSAGYTRMSTMAAERAFSGSTGEIKGMFTCLRRCRACSPASPAL